VASPVKVPGLGEVEVVVEEEGDELGVYTIYGEDHTIGNLLEKILLTIDGVELASYEMPHPLEPKIVVRVRTNGKLKPREALLKAIDKALELLEDLKRKYLEELRRAGREIEE